MVDVNGQAELSGPLAKARDRMRLLESCRGRVLVCLDRGSSSKVRATVKFSRTTTVRQG